MAVEFGGCHIGSLADSSELGAAHVLPERSLNSPPYVVSTVAATATGWYASQGMVSQTISDWRVAVSEAMAATCIGGSMGDDNLISE